MQTEMARYRQLENWFATPFGCYVAAAEADFFARKLAAAAGETALQIGWPQWPLLQHAAAIRHKVYQHHQPQADVCAQPMALPWPENSFDVVVLPHGLEVAANAPQLLAELQRVLMPHGRLLLTGLNPAGYWRLNARSLCRDVDLHSVGAVRSWLAQAGLSLQEGSFMAYGWPWMRRPKAPVSAIEYMGNRWWPHQAAVYGLVAGKEVLSVRPDAKLAKQLRELKDLQLVGAGSCSKHWGK